MTKRFFLIITILLVMAGQGWTATYYVNTATGDDGNNGTAAGTPWLHSEYALLMLSAGDTLNIIAPATTPDRGAFATSANGAAGNIITVQGTSATNRAYFAGSYDVTHGSTIYPTIQNGSFEGWKGDGTLWKIGGGGSSGSSTFAKETTTVHSGVAGVKIVRSTTSIFPAWVTNITLPAATEVTLSYWHQEAGGTYRPKYSIIDLQSGSNQYLQADGTTWAAGAYTFDPNDNSTGAWRQHTRTFTTNRQNKYNITFTINGDGTYYLDDLSITPTVTTYVWEVHDAPSGTYKLTGWLPTAVSTFSKCTKTAWTASGLEALQLVYKVADAATCVTTENSFAFVSGVLYYHPPAGETFADMHLEASFCGSGTNSFSVANSYYNFNYINSYLSEGSGLYVTGGNNNFSYINSKFNYGTPMLFTGAGSVSNVVSYSDSGYSQQDGIQTLEGASATFNFVRSHHNRDDGFQNGNATMVNNYCIADHNGGWATSPDSPNCGWENGSLSGACNSTLYNCVSYGNYDAGYSLSLLNHTATIKNCVAYGNGASRGDLYCDGNITLTHDYNIGGTKNPSWTLGAHESLADPKFLNASATGADFHLLGSSPCIKTGTPIAGLTTDFAGAAIGNPPNMGAYEGMVGGGGLSPGLGLGGNRPAWVGK